MTLLQPAMAMNLRPTKGHHYALISAATSVQRLREKLRPHPLAASEQQQQQPSTARTLAATSSS